MYEKINRILSMLHIFSAGRIMLEPTQVRVLFSTEI